MKLVLDVEIPGTPMAVQSVRSAQAGKFIRHYQPAKVTNWKGYIRAFIASKLPENWTLLDGGIAMEYEFVFPPLKSMKKKTIQDIEAGEIIYKITKPDLEDNLKKGLNDAMTGIVWTDDSRIAIGKGKKFYGTVPKIRIKVFTGLRTE